MFENFVYFGEVIKLSSNIFIQLRSVNYSWKVISVIESLIDIDSLGEVIDLVDEVTLYDCFIYLFYTVHELEKERIKLVKISYKYVVSFFKYNEPYGDEGFICDIPFDYILYICCENDEMGIIKYLVNSCDNKGIFDEILTFGALCEKENICRYAVENGGSFKEHFIAMYIGLEKARRYLFRLGISKLNNTFEK